MPGTIEALADAIALTHPDFIEGDKWKQRVENQAKRLEDEEQFMSPVNPRQFGVGFRARYLRRWLALGHVRAYMSSDVDPRIHLAFPLYVLAGFYAHPLSSYAPIVFWGLVLAMVLGVGQLGLNAMRTNELLVKLDAALKRKLERTEPSMPVKV